MSELFEPVDGFDRRFARSATGLLRTFNEVGLLEAADVHVAERTGLLGPESDERVLLAVALAVRATRHGSVCVSLAEASAAQPDLPWPELAGWSAAVADSVLVGPVLRIEGDLIYLHRYWSEEGQVVDDLLARRDNPAPVIDEDRLATALADLFAGAGYDEQRIAAEASTGRWTSVITGGPGTGKTTTLSRLLAALRFAGGDLRIGLAAPTGKAAARMSQAIRDAASDPSFPASYRPLIEGLEASTLHRLLGFRPDNSTRFRHDRHHRLPHDVVVVDEASMVSLTMMARLLEAVRPDARLILVGDPDQLTSVEAGAVLKNVVAGFADAEPSPVSRLTVAHRFGETIGGFANAIRDNRADEAWEMLQAGSDHLALIEVDDPTATDEVATAVFGGVVALDDAARSGDPARMLAALGDQRLLCAHRDGPFGVGHWNRQLERLLMERHHEAFLPQWYPGRALIVNVNDYGLRLWNGDTGVVTGDGRTALIDDGTPEGRVIPVARLGDIDTAFAMTVHRSQGSQFRDVVILLPEPDAPTLTRELLYTAVTRAQNKVTVVATEAAVKAAISRPAIRATGLESRLRR